MDIGKEKLDSSEMYYDTAELSNLKYVKVIYTAADGNYREVSTAVKFIGDMLISLFFKHSKNFDINYPQDVTIKFVTDDAMYMASAVLQEIKRVDNFIYFSVKPPKKMVRRQNRKYCRVDLRRTCVLVVSDDKGSSSTYLSKTINLSACGVLIHDLETMLDDKPEKVEMSKYGCYHLIIFLEPTLVLKLFARFVRHECVRESNRYAFQFLSMKPKDTDAICKYVTKEQVRQLKLMQKIK